MLTRLVFCALVGAAATAAVPVGKAGLDKAEKRGDADVIFDLFYVDKKKRDDMDVVFDLVYVDKEKRGDAEGK